MREKPKSPCRYKKCKGVIHRGKCPVASSRGSKGGSKVGSSKSRIGSQNGRFVGLRECGCPQRQHKITCSKSQKLTKITKAIINNHDFNYDENASLEIYDKKMQLKFPQPKLRLARKENIPIKRQLAKWEFENAAYVKSIPHFSFLKYTGVCASCAREEKVTLASKIHIEDIKYRLPKVNYFKARIICNACEA